MSVALASINSLRRRSWRIIGYWAWELPTFPSGWERAFPHVSEIWTLSEYSASVFASHPHAPKVLSFPIAVKPPIAPQRDRKRFALDENSFVVLTMADTHSSFARKNPIGAIAAFKQAFADRKDCLLVVKARNLASSPQAEAALHAAIGCAPNIKIMDRVLSEHDKWTLLGSIDTLISLHRAEGFGMPIAEAMATGVPVIATGWSGNLSFMTSSNSRQVDHTLVRTEDPYGVYTGHDAQWAEPDISHAAHLLRQMQSESDLRHRIGAAGKDSILGLCDYAPIGEAMAQALRH